MSIPTSGSGAAAELFAVLGVKGATTFAAQLAEASAVSKREAKKIDGALDGVGSGMGPNMARQTALAESSMQRLGRRATTLGMGLTKGATLPLLGLGLAAVKTTMGFDTQMSKVQALTGATGAKLEQLRGTAIRLGATTNFSATEAAQGMANFGAAGLSATQVIAAMPGALSAAAASGEDLASVSEIMVTTMSGFGLAASKTTHIADVLAQSANSSTASIGDMGETLKYVSPVARSVGISLEQVAAMSALMANAGVKGSQAGTSLRMALTRLAVPLPDRTISRLKEVSPELAKIATSSLPVPQKLAAVSKEFEGLDGKSKASASALLFGTEAMSGMLAVVNAGPARLKQLTNEMRDSDGAAKKMATTMRDNLGGDLDNAMGALQSLGIDIGTALTPGTRAATQAVTGMVQSMDAGFQHLGGEAQRDVLIVSGALAGLGPAILAVKGAAGGLATVFGPAVAAVTGVGTALGTLAFEAAAGEGALAALGLAAAANPLLAGSLVVAGLAAGALALLHFAGNADHVGISAKQAAAAAKALNDAVQGISDANVGALSSTIAYQGALLNQKAAHAEVRRLQQAGQQGTLEYAQAVNSAKQADVQATQALGAKKSAISSNRSEVQKATDAARINQSVLVQEAQKQADLADQIKAVNRAGNLNSADAQAKKLADLNSQLAASRERASTAASALDAVRGSVSSLGPAASSAANDVLSLQLALANLPDSKTVRISVQRVGGMGTDLGRATGIAASFGTGSMPAPSKDPKHSSFNSTAGPGLGDLSMFQHEAARRPGAGLAGQALSAAELAADDSLSALAQKERAAERDLAASGRAVAAAHVAFLGASKKKRDEKRSAWDQAKSQLASNAGNLVSIRGQITSGRKAAADAKQTKADEAQAALLSTPTSQFASQETALQIRGALGQVDEGGLQKQLAAQYQAEVDGYQALIASGRLKGDQITQANQALLTAAQNLQGVQQQTAAAVPSWLDAMKSSHALFDAQAQAQLALADMNGDAGAVTAQQRQLVADLGGQIDEIRGRLAAGGISADEQVALNGELANLASQRKGLTDQLGQMTWLATAQSGWASIENRLGAQVSVDDLVGDATKKAADQRQLLAQFESEVAAIQGQIAQTKDPSQLAALWSALGQAAQSASNLKGGLDGGSSGGDGSFISQMVGGSGGGGNSGTSVSTSGGGGGVGYVPDPDAHPVFFGGVQVNTLGWDAAGGVGVKVLQLTGWDDGEDEQVAVDNRVGADGEIPREMVLGGSTVVIEGVVGGSSRQDLYARRKALKAIFVPTRDEKVLKLPDAALAGAALTAYAESMSGYLRKSCRVSQTVVWGDAVGVNAHKFKVTLRASDPRRYDDVPINATTSSIATDSGVGFPMAFPVSFGSGGTGGTVAVVNAGDYQAPWVARVAGPVTNPVVEDQSGLGQIVTTGLTINAGDFVDFDLQARTAYLNADVTQSRIAAVDFSATKWWLLPAGTSTVRLRGSSISDPSTLTVMTRAAYI